MKKLAIITTHPIQYNAPLFRLLQQRNNICIKVFYTWGKGVLENKYDPGFNKAIEWDIPLLEGYAYTFVENISKNPGSEHYKGIDNPTLIEEIKEWDPNAILVFGWSFKSHLKVLRYFKGKRTILFRGDSTLLNEAKGFAVKKIIRRIFLKKIYSYIDIALYVGNANKAYYEKFGLKRHQLVFAPHAIDNDRYRQESKENLRQHLFIPKSDMVFLFAGKFEVQKNVALLLEAFLHLGFKNVHLILVGNGCLEKNLKSKAAEQGLDMRTHIHFMDFQNQSKMPQLYQTGDVIVLPSQSETWGLIVNEAMASGKAVLVSSQCGCARDLVIDGVNGYVFKSNNKKDLEQKMRCMVTNRHLMAEMGQQSLAIIQSWSYENICVAIEELLI